MSDRITTVVLTGWQSHREQPDPGPEPGPDEERQYWEAQEAAAGQALAAGVTASRRAMLTAPAWGLLAGMGLRAHLPHPAAAVAAVIAALAVVGAVVPEVALRTARGQDEPGWVRDLDRYRRWLPQRDPAIPGPVLAAVDYYLTKVTRRRWQSAHLLVARRGDLPQLPMGTITERAGRLVIYLGDYIACGTPQAAIATLAHEIRHQYGWRRTLDLISVTARRRGFVVAGWAAPWPGALWAALALHATLMITSWAIETGCDLGAAADTGPAAMSAAFDAMSAARHRSGGRPVTRAARTARFWAAGPVHPPIPVRRALVRAYGRLRPGQPRICGLRPAASGSPPPGEPVPDGLRPAAAEEQSHARLAAW